jgi:cobalt-zinc-cadmium efflux system outer membrane protein
MHSPVAARPRGRKRCGSVHVAVFLAFCFSWLAGTATANVSPPADPPRSTGPLTLDSALRQFREHGFDLLIADASLDAAEADVRTSAEPPNPSLSLSRGSSATYDPSRCSGCSNISTSAGITDQGALSDLLTGKRRLRIEVARAARDIAKSSRADVERTLEFTVKAQVLQAELARRSLDYARESQQLAAGTLALVEKRYHAGAVSEADVARAAVLKLEADQSADAATQALASAKAGLAYLLGFPSTPEDLDVLDDLLQATPQADLEHVTTETMLPEALRHRPDLALARSQAERARSSLLLTRRMIVPDLLPSLNYSAEGRGQNAIQPPTVTFGISATIPVFNQFRGEIAHAAADVRAQETAERKAEAQVANDVATAVAAFRSAHSRLARMDNELLASAARARDLVGLQYEKGAVSLFEYLDVQRTWLATRTEYLQTLNDYWTAVFQLEQATGMELRS